MKKQSSAKDYRFHGSYDQSRKGSSKVITRRAARRKNNRNVWHGANAE